MQRTFIYLALRMSKQQFLCIFLHRGVLRIIKSFLTFVGIAITYD